MITIDRRTLINGLIQAYSYSYASELRFNNDPSAPFGYGTLDFMGAQQMRVADVSSTGADFSVSLDPEVAGNLRNRLFALTTQFGLGLGGPCTLEVDGDTLVLTYDLQHYEFPILGPATTTFNIIVLMRGLPGAGKTTWIQENLPNATVVSADHYFMDRGEYVFDRSRVEKAHDWCKHAFSEAIRSGDEVIVVDNTNVTLDEMGYYLSEARWPWRHSHHEVYIQEVGRDLTAQQLFERCTHNIPLDVIEDRMSKWEEYSL